MRYFLVVGEASADLHASNLIRAIRALDPEASFMFMGGSLMQEASGVAPIVHYREVAFMGILPVLTHLSTIRHAAERVREAIRSFAPDVVIPVDFAGFNMRYILPYVAEEIGCPIVYYIAPKLWAWKRWRIHKLRRYTHLMLCILPFEEAFFGRYGLRAQYVGNPCVDAVRAHVLDQEVAQAHSHHTSRPCIAILAGSRRQELRSNLEVMLTSTKALSSDYNIVIAGAPGLCADDYAPYLQHYPWAQLTFDATYSIVQRSCAALVTSGTATLEVALLGTPLIVCYRMGGQRIARWVFEHCFSTPYISLVNLILGRAAIPELIGAEVNAPRLSRELAKILVDGPTRQGQLKAMQELRLLLGDQYSSRAAAEAIFQELSATASFASHR